MIRPAVLLLVAMPLLAQERARPRVQLTTTPESRVGDPIHVKVSGLPANREVVLFSELVDRYGRSWIGESTFESTADGVVDPAKAEPVRAGWKGVDGAGPFWALTRKTAVGAHPEPESGNAERLSITAIVDGRPVATDAAVRWHRTRNVIAKKITDDGMVARLFVPEGGGRRPAVLVMTGSGGGITGAIHHAEHFASHGFVTLALAYFGIEGLPRNLEKIPLEYFGRALDWMQRHPRIDPQRIGIFGTSKGGELVVLLASRRPDVRAVVGVVPSSVVWQSIAPSWPRTSSWSEAGAPLPFVPYARSPRFRKTGRLSFLYEDGMKNAAAVQKAVIPIERAQAAILLVSGRDDWVWPATAMCDRIVERLTEKNYSRPFRHLAYDAVGHEVFAPPFRPVSWSPRNGGTRQGHAKARAAVWPATLQFLRRSLGAK